MLSLQSCKTKQNVLNTEVAHRYIDSVRYQDTVRVFEYSNDTTHYILEERIKYRYKTLTDTVRLVNEKVQTVEKQYIPNWIYIFIGAVVLLLLIVIFALKRMLKLFNDDI